MMHSWSRKVKTEPKKRMRKQESSDKRHVPGPRIVRAWFDTVINPILLGLRGERSLLLRRNWTWNFRPGVLEAIRPVEQYVPFGARENLVQFLSFHQSVRSHVQQHDKWVSTLRDTCERLYHALLHRSTLPQIFDRLTSQDSLLALREKYGGRLGFLAQSTPEQMVSQFFGAYPKSDHLSLIAQYIINNNSENGKLPEHFTTAPFWNEHWETFLKVFDVPEIRKLYTDTSTAGANLMQESDGLSVLLQQIRLELSVQHDVPYVEPSSLRGSEGPLYG
jgi:hypothetical protein